MINFYPGPSKLDPQIGNYLQEAYNSGILEMNHRSDAFMCLFKETVQLVKEKLNIPADYEVVFVSSATECWEIISQSFIKSCSFHCYNGAFGEKWFDYAQKLHGKSSAESFGVEQLPDLNVIRKDAELLAFTHNETANGSVLPVHFQKSVRQQFPNSLIAYDCTSSMAGYALKWELGDIWFASVQKCFGLPPGLAVMVVSPKAVERAELLDDNKFYNSFNYILSNTRKNQTHHTPNISNIFLLNRTFKKRASIHSVHSDLKARKEKFDKEIAHFKALSFYVKSPELQSDTVFCLTGDGILITMLKSEAKERAIILGNGYGDLKYNSIRVANFPSILQSEFDQLILFLADFFKAH